MKQFAKYLMLIPAMLLVLGISAVAFAEDGGSDSGQSGSDGSSIQTSGSDDSNQTDQSTTSSDSSKDTETVRHRLQQKLENQTETENSQISKDRGGASDDKLTTEADDILGQLFKQVGHHHTQTERQKNCQAAEHGLEKKLANLQTNSQNMLDRINTVLAKVLAYQQAQNLNPSGLSDLLSAANADQATTTMAVASLQALPVNLDCSSSAVPTTVASFKAAGQDARTALQTYRQAVKNIIVALANASSTSTTQTTGGTQ